MYVFLIYFKIFFVIFFSRDTRDFEGESKAASSLGEVFLQMGEFESALEYHQMDYDISESHESMEGKVIVINFDIIWYYYEKREKSQIEHLLRLRPLTPHNFMGFAP